MRARLPTLLRIAAATVAFLLSPAAAHADTGGDTDTELRQAQAALDAHYAQQRAVCARRFFVNACLHRVEASWREADAALRARRVALERAHRAELAAQERARVAAGLAARSAPQPRAPGQPHSAPSPRPRAPRVLQAPPVHDASAARAAYQRKLRDYEERRASAARQPRDAAPLPLP
jgi:hypothetical protein